MVSSFLPLVRDIFIFFYGKELIYMIIIRKPESMRNDSAMEYYLHVAKSCEYLRTHEKDEVKKWEHRHTYWDSMNKAAKAGGFLRVKDLERWLKNKGLSI